MNQELFEKEYLFAEKILIDKSKLEEENEKLKKQIELYNLFINEILNRIHEFKENIILNNKK